MSRPDLLSHDGVAFRDLDGDGVMAPYEDPRRPVPERVGDLLARMTLAEKAGLMCHAPVAVAPDGGLVEEPSGLLPAAPTTRAVRDLHLRCLALMAPVAAGPLARWHNRLQDLAARSRLGIPVLVSSDPRHSANDNPLTSVPSGGCSRWPEPLGFGALRDEDAVREFARAIRAEYTAVGIRMAIHPMADLASEPRWCRTAGTFGADPEVVGRLAGAYVEELQGPRLGPGSVASMVKHWPGAGPQAGGEDAHFAHGSDQVYPAGLFELHRDQFRPSLRAGAAAVMPYYGRPVGVPGLAGVGFAFDREVVAGLLRRDEGYDGIVCTDFGLLTDAVLADGSVWPARAWGVEHLGRAERALLLLDAGVDQLGGEWCPEVITGLVAAGRVSEARIDESAGRVLSVLFRLGLFENPYVDEERAVATVGRADFAAAGAAAQRRSMTLLRDDAGILPLASGIRLYVEGVDPQVAARYATVAARPQDADAALVRIAAPYEPRERLPEALFHQGRLDLPEPEREHLCALAAALPTVIDVFVERPPVIPELAESGAALLADFGADDAAVLDVVFGHARPEGRLPVELPRSMAAVEAHPEDLPGGTPDPVFPLGHAAEARDWRPRPAR
ncbi:beta-glucosidase [Thermocatellispora tengchongensis]|uniref:beta-glucosidase n=1 Tax=Thermocatellispora tengchongensis TaxID=1073253 RepID=A0A840P1X6_9ACTN|nr:glycoside hydrolase family 3 N-terminal domain-containing protein [Thermocatellispora tengchongensis]MBB5133362.1 beta-glucosidase [Thermocatellispora tengchongensis]